MNPRLPLIGVAVLAISGAVNSPQLSEPVSSSALFGRFWTASGYTAGPSSPGAYLGSDCAAALYSGKSGVSSDVPTGYPASGSLTVGGVREVHIMGGTIKFYVTLRATAQRHAAAKPAISVRGAVSIVSSGLGRKPQIRMAAAFAVDAFGPSVSRPVLAAQGRVQLQGSSRFFTSIVHDSLACPAEWTQLRGRNIGLKLVFLTLSVDGPRGGTSLAPAPLRSIQDAVRLPAG